MGRSGSVLVAVALFSGLVGCSSSSPTNIVNFPTPAIIKLSPSPTASIELGKTLSFTGTPQDKSGASVTTPVEYISSNTAVLTIAANGNACAGTWDSLSNPQVCTPGPVGTAQVTSTAMGVSSPPTTVYVHQRVDDVEISVTPAQNPPTSFTSFGCLSVDQTLNLQATAFNRGVDITSSVGSFTWQAINNTVVKLDNTVSGLATNQVQVTGAFPGLSRIYATGGDTTSLPLSFETCRVQSISLAVTDSNDSTIVLTQGTSKTIEATVVDIAGTTITGVPLTWSSSSSTSVAVSGSNSTGKTSTGGVTTPLLGGGSVIASCTPPTCNIGFQPSLPIYPENVINVVVTPSSTTSTQSTTVLVSSTGCGTTNNCISALVPVTVPANTVSDPTTLPATPNSLVYEPRGSLAYLGTNSTLLGSTGLMVVNVGTSPPVTTFSSISGTVLAISPDSTRVVISDTANTPNEVFVLNCSGNPCTADSPIATLPIAGATAASFSPDGLKAYVLAGSTLYVYSTQDTLKAIPLAAPANDVAFLTDGAFAYVAGGTTSGITTWITCTDTQAAPAVSTAATPAFLKSLPDSSHVLAVVSPGVDLLNVSTTPVGCPPTVTNGAVASFNLGQGSFVPTQLLVSSDGTHAYVLTSNLSTVLVFDTANLTPSAIALAGNAVPIRGALTTDGAALYVTATDGQLHALDTVTGIDKAQVSFPKSFCQDSTGQPAPVSCPPDLIAIKP